MIWRVWGTFSLCQIHISVLVFCSAPPLSSDQNQNSCKPLVDGIRDSLNGLFKPRCEVGSTVRSQLNPHKMPMVSL